MSVLLELKIKHVASIAFPRATGQVDISNRTISLRTKEKNRGEFWLLVEELPNVIWAYM